MRYKIASNGPVMLNKNTDNELARKALATKFILRTTPSVSCRGVNAVNEPFCISMTSSAFLFFMDYNIKSCTEAVAIKSLTARFRRNLL